MMRRKGTIRDVDQWITTLSTESLTLRGLVNQTNSDMAELREEVESLREEVASLGRVLNSRTEHLA